MKKMIDTFCALSQRLETIYKKESFNKIIEEATTENEWFDRDSIIRAIEAICTQMLQRDRLEVWAAHYPALPVAVPRNVAIIMAGNIPLVGFFDLLCTCMAGHNCWVKTSSKDSVLMNYIMRELREIDQSIPIYMYNDEMEFDAVIATGGYNANRHFKGRYKNSKHLLRGNRHSVAILNGDENRAELDTLNEDIYAYSGLGCRNVSMIFVPRGYKCELSQYPTSQKYRNNYLQTRALLTLNKIEFIDTGSSCLVPSHELPHSLSSISIYEYESLEEVKRWISSHNEELQCIVSNIIEHERCVGFGMAQSPMLTDYPDAIDVMKFLDI